MARKQVFVTERLLLQPLDPQNAEDLLVIFSFDEVRSQMLTTTFSTIDETTEWIEAVSNRPNSSIFSISLRQNSSEMIGIIGLNSFDRLLYSFNPDFWGAGYCTEVLRWFLKQLFEKQPERRTLVAGVHNGNEGSVRVLLKCGFVEVDSLENAMSGFSNRGGNGDSQGGEVEILESSSPANSYTNFTWFYFERPLVVKE
ncbi:acyl-CoA N-acyltransferase [Hyaloscypha bicolor E]|uniref:Acyl-CoA N-acyltransferase n=1 Tax=Hyaloscypha bicolor E TaxID=1095630 RepID=A0A2J6SW06_9HELO|nr:acyl-CoA N-acyltransferase [Hyaloscypha bicolor E]PMD54949.1 acyl-CoA N-acyltransferase [Hyaloscypha bicolor E]